MENKIKLMTHQVLGYPDFDTNTKALQIFEKHHVDYVELQIPFTECSADGPAFQKANQLSIDRGTTVSQSMHYIKQAIARYPMKFLVMTYYNIIYQYGTEKFIKEISEMGIWGMIIPDAPTDEAKEVYSLSIKYGIHPIVIITPYTDNQRLVTIASHGKGFIYYVPRKGVTGAKTAFNIEIKERIRQIKSITGMACAVGFGIQEKEDVDFLADCADIAVIGSQITRLIEENGIAAVDHFLGTLRRKEDEHTSIK